MSIWEILILGFRLAQIVAGLKAQGKTGRIRTQLVMQVEQTGEEITVPFVTITV